MPCWNLGTERRQAGGGNRDDRGNQKRRRAEQYEDEALPAAEEDRAPIDHAIGAVEGGARRLDAVRGEVERDQRRDGEQAAVRAE